MDLRIAGGGGALCSTLNDVLDFHIKLKNGEIITKKNYDLMIEKHTFASNNDYYCYGVCRGHNDNGEYLYHAGGGPGVRSMYYEYIDSNVMFFMVTNVNDAQKHASFFTEIRSLINEIKRTQ